MLDEAPSVIVPVTVSVGVVLSVGCVTAEIVPLEEIAVGSGDALPLE